MSAPEAGRASTRLSRGRLAALGAVVGLLLGLATYALFFSSWLVVDRVEVRGTDTLSAAEVSAAAAVPAGTPLARVDIDGVVERVEELRPVQSVSVRRRWPDALVLTVDERDPALVLAGADGLTVFDLAGVEFLHPAEAPVGVPVLRVGGAEPTPDVVDAVLLVLAQLPTDVRERLGEVVAPTPDAIALRLGGGVVIEWGSSQDNARKAQVLEQLMRHPASVYNVTAPDVPAIRPLPTSTP